MKKRDEVLVGLLLVAATAVGVVGSIWLARGGLAKGYPLYSRFSWGAGLRQGQPVWLSGVSVGYVASIDFRRDASLVVEMRIEDQYHIPKPSTATVVPNGLFGDMAIAVKPGLPTTNNTFAPGDTIPTGVPAPGLQELTGKADSVAAAVNAITGEMQRQLVTGGGMADMRRSMAQLNALLAQLSGVVATQSKELSLTMGSVRRTASAIDSAKVDSLQKNMVAASDVLVASSRQMQAATQHIAALTARIDSGGGTVGKLLNDDKLYEDLRATNARMGKTLDSLTALIADIKKNPKKYISVKVF